MVTLLIADRDPNECIGIEWLVKNYSIGFERQYLVHTMDDLVKTIEEDNPSVLCLEIDLVPASQFETVKRLIQRYAIKTIVVTAEATFERALQALEVRAYEFWVKPFSLEKVKKTLQSVYRQSKTPKRNSVLIETNQNPIGYNHLLQKNDKTRGIKFVSLLQMNKSRLADLHRFLKEYPFPSSVAILPLSEMIAVVHTDNNLDAADVYQELRTILREWNERYQEAVTIVLYYSKNTSISLHEKYLNALNAFEIRFFQGNRDITLIEDDVKWETIDPFLTSSEQRAWIEMLNNKDKENIKHWMYQQFLNIKEPYPSPGLLRIRLTSILAQIRRFMKNFHLDTVNPFEISYQKVFQSILYETVLYRIVQDLLLFVYEVIDGVSLQQQKATTDIVEQAIHYIQTHYKNPNLSLENVANFVDRSSSYTSHILAKRLGTNFRELVNQMRMKEAEKLLLGSNMGIQQISYEIGFRNANYFSRVFKQKHNTTPREFKAKKSI